MKHNFLYFRRFKKSYKIKKNQNNFIIIIVYNYIYTYI